MSLIAPLIAPSAEAHANGAKRTGPSSRKQVVAVELARAWKDAKRARRPLLVMLERAGTHTTARGAAWAAFGRGASLAAENDLRRCVLAFASAAHVSELWPALVLDEAKLPFGIVIHPDGTVARIEPASETPPRLDSGDEAQRATFEVWCAAVARSIHGAVVPADAERTVPTPSRFVFDARPRTPTPLEQASRARDVFAGSAPSGARWARQIDSCGTLELDSGERIGGPSACGTGLVSREARQFFWLYLRPKPA